MARQTGAEFRGVYEKPSIPQSQKKGNDTKYTGKMPTSRPYYMQLGKNGNGTVQKWEHCEMYTVHLC